MDFAQPTRIDEALDLLATGDWTILSGGTDFYPAIAEDMPRTPVLDVSALRELRGIEKGIDGWRIGALTTWSDLIAADLPAGFDALKQAGREVGSRQIQNRATICGNLCNASPAADGVPPLLCLDAEVVLSSQKGSRRLPLDEFLRGNRQTALARDEMMTELYVPDASAHGASRFCKLGARKYLVISISMVAARLEWAADGVVRSAAVSVGACSAVAQRLGALETALVGQGPERRLAELVTADHLKDLSPIDDVRATSEYRMAATLQLVRQVLGDLEGEAP